MLEENVKYLEETLKSLTKFSKSVFEIIDYSEIEIKEQEFEEIRINVSSSRLDSIVSEIARISRTKAEEILKEEKVFINSKCEIKPAKILKERDVLAIRGKGKFVIDKIIENSKNGRELIIVKKYK